EEREVDQELDEPLRELREGVGGLEVVEPDQVDERERSEETEQDRRGARHARAREHDVAREEREREEVGERDGAGHVPVHLLVRAAEHGAEEEEARQTAETRAGRLLGARHTTSLSRSASSCTRARLETFVRHSSSSRTGSSVP